MLIRNLAQSTCLLLVILISGCQTAVSSPPPAVSSPTPELLQDTLTPTIIQSTTIPQVNPPAIDGVISPGEWDGALQELFSDGSELLLLRNENYLYLGIHSNNPGMIAGNIFIHRGDKIAILHVSAALGTAIYKAAAHDWQQIQEFTWRCRDTSDSAAAQAERETFLQQEQWVSRNSRTGTPEELEYQIAMTDENLGLVVTFFRASEINTRIHWPTHIDDDCTRSFEGGIPIQLNFSPEKWATITQSNSGDFLLNIPSP
jgi:hypothetical protein